MTAIGQLGRIRWRATLAALGTCVLASTAWPQGEGATVFVDDSTAAQSVMRSLPSLIRAGNQAEAVRSLQRVLETAGDRLVPSDNDANLFISVRQAVHGRLLADAGLLERYRTEFTVRADRLFQEGSFAQVEREYLLTGPGRSAALMVARERFGLARFHAAALALAQLEGHPDLHKDAQAAELLTLVAAQVDDASVAARAQAWRQAAGLEPAVLPSIAIPPPASVLRRDASVLEGGGLPSNMPREPLWVQAIDRDLPTGPDDRLPTVRGFDARGGPFWILPSVAGDTILINDGATISAWDRFALRLRWRTSILPEGPLRESLVLTRQEQTDWRAIEAPNMLALDARAAYASMGLHTATSVDIASGIVAVELATGRRLWSVEPRTIDQRYALANVRGGPVAAEGRVVFGLREDFRSGRQVSLALVGLDTRTGEVAWARTMGSAGTGWARSNRAPGAGGIVHAGIVYWYDPMGIVAAYDAHDGRPLWLRRFELPQIIRQRADAEGAWAIQAPVMADGWLVTLVGGQDMIYRLDPMSGRVEGGTTTFAMGDAKYLVGLGSTVAAVGPSSVVFFEPTNLSPNMVPRDGSRIADFRAAITGRAVPAGGRLLAPSGVQAVLIDPATGRSQGPVIELPRAGALLPLDDQLIIADTAVLTSLMHADVATRALDDRLRDNPDDVASLVSLVLLAERRQVLNTVPAAADRALQALAKSIEQGGAHARLARVEGRRLFEALLSMLHTMVRQADAEIDQPLPDQLADLALRAAPDPIARARTLLTVSDLRDRQGRGAQALTHLLEVLADTALRDVRLPDNNMLAGVRATRRIAALLPMHGYEIIEPHEPAAAQALQHAQPGPAGDVQRLAIASTLPISAAALQAYTDVARHAHEAGDIARAARAYRKALDIARLLRTSDGPVDSARVAALGASLTHVLAQGDHIAAAARTRARLTLIAPIEDTDAPSTESLAQRFAQRTRAAEIGDRPVAVDQRLDGWRLLPPLSVTNDASLPEHLVLISGHMVGLWALSPDLGPIEGEPFEADPRGPLEMVWSSTFDPATPPILLSVDRHRALFVWTQEGTPRLRAVSLFDASSWTSPPFEELFDAPLREPVLGDRGAHVSALTATGQQADPLGWIIAHDHALAAIVRRDGLLAILDMDTGKVNAARRPGLGTVMDVAVAAGRVWVMGSAEAPGSQRAGALDTMGLWAFNETGQLVARRIGTLEAPRWISAVDDGSLVVATYASIERVAPSGQDTELKVLWNAVDRPAINAAMGWVLGDVLAVLSTRGDVALARLEDGKFASEPTPLNLVEGEVPRLSRQQDRVLVLSSQGLLILNASGQTTGRDALRGTGGRAEEKAPPALGERRVLLAPLRSFSLTGNQGEYLISTVDTATAKVTGTRAVALPEAPRDVRLIDGYAAVSTATRTVILRME